MERKLHAPNTWWLVNTVSMTLVLLLLIPAMLMSDQFFSRVPASGIYVNLRTAPSATPQVAPGPVVRIEAKRTVSDKGYAPWSKGNVYVGGNRVAWSDMGQSVRIELAKRAQNTVYLSGDGELDWSDIVLAMDEIHAATNCQILLTGRNYDVAAGTTVK